MGAHCNFRLGILATISILGSTPSWAYSLDDHRKITGAAAQSLQNCFPGAISSEALSELIEANLWEDQNLLRKWLGYSHFYHPHFGFDSSRATSRDRIIDLESQLAALPSRDEKVQLLGKALHHLQDMTVPPHVVPVNHFWTDGFESLEVAVSPAFTFTSCESLLTEAIGTPLTELHQSLAEDTWQTVISGALSGSTRGPDGRSLPRTLPATFFWQPNASSDSGWGAYGAAGNHFGDSTLTVGHETVRISSDQYRQFKQQRLQAALRSTQLMLVKYWMLSL